MATTRPESNHTQEQQLAHSQNQTFAQLALQSQLSQLNPKNKRKSWMDNSVDRVGELKKKNHPTQQLETVTLNTKTTTSLQSV